MEKKPEEEKTDLELIKETEKPTEEEVKKKLKEVHAKIVIVLKKYMDLKEEYYNINALWIIGTYFHPQFLTYPYLFFNSMRGSGKTRMLKLLASLSKNGKVITDIKEAVLFRTAKESTFCIDEIENIGKREKATLRELLNSAYKRGIGVERTRKIFGEHSEYYKVDKFDVFCPVSMANLWGLDDVLGDRCIYIVLEKSNNPRITKLLEIFDYDPDIKEIHEDFSVVMSFVRFFSRFNIIYSSWNNYIQNIQNNTKQQYNKNTYNNTTTTTTTEMTKVLGTNSLSKNECRFTNETTLIGGTNNLLFFDKVNKTALDSRSLELFFPLFIIADCCNTLDETIKTAEEITIAKKEEDVIESKDVVLIDFISQRKEDRDYIQMKELLKEFKDYLEEDEEDAKWTNIKWLGKALRRLNLIKRKRRLAFGREVILDYEKARSQIRMFKPIIKKQEENICPKCKLKVEEADWNNERGMCKWCAEPKNEKLENDNNKNGKKA